MLARDGRPDEPGGGAVSAVGGDGVGEVGDGTRGGVTPDRIATIVARLRSTTAALRARSVADIAEALGRTGERFLDEEDDLRREALERLLAEAGLSAAMARLVLDGMARDWTRERLSAWLSVELGDARCLDGLVVEGADQPSRGGPPSRAVRRLMAVGPSLCTQIVAGSVPGVGVSALLRSLVVKAPTLLKPGRGDVVLPELFARGLREADEALADSLAVLYWPGGSAEVERAAVAEADIVVVYGSDETVSAVRALLPPTARLVAYHHRIGVALVGREALTEEEASSAAAGVARAVAAFDQRGCVCPHLVLVERGATVEPESFARRLAESLEELAGELPAAALTAEEASAVQQLRGNAELRAASGHGEVWHGGADASWTVVYEPVATPGPGTLGRAVRVVPIEDATEAADVLRPLGAHLQTVGVTGLGERTGAVTEALGRLGASRVTPLEGVSFPPPWWMHDGRGGLQALVRWVELDEEV